jgi:Tol biopolymer transport system component
MLATGHGPPAWSPDGRRIAFEQSGDIYAINVDGSSQTNLTTNPADDTFPVWSPDGRQIAFISERDGNKEIYVMNADGSHQTRLTTHPEDDTNPVWSPTIN